MGKVKGLSLLCVQGDRDRFWFWGLELDRS